MASQWQHPAINTEHEAGQTASTVFQVFGMTRQGIGPSLPPALVACGQTVPLGLFVLLFEKQIWRKLTKTVISVSGKNTKSHKEAMI